MRKQHNRSDNTLRWLGVLQPGGHTKRESIRTLKKPMYYAAVLIVGVAFAAVVLQLFHLQIIEGAHNRDLANGNRIRERIVYAARGRIMDRNGKVIADNVLSTQLVVYPYLLNTDASNKGHQIRSIANALGVNDQEIAKLIDSFPPDDIQAHLIDDTISQETIIKLEKVSPETPAFSLEDVPKRKYDARFSMGTIIGYTGLVTQQNLEDDTSGELLPTDSVGREGIESSYDARLRGRNGREKIEVDALGRPLGLLARQNAQPGDDITLTIDIDLQAKLNEAVQKYMDKAQTKRAAGLVVDPRNGEVLAMVSLPNYDNNEFVGGIGTERYAQLNTDQRQPLVNKVISNGYPTGSIIKPLVASAALQERIVSPETTIVDRGFLELRSQYDQNVVYRYNGWNQSGLGPMQVRSAIAFSSNIYFYTVGGGYESQPGLGVDKLTSYYRAFGLGEQSGIKLPNEQYGRVPDRDWKKRTTGEDWFVGDTYNISIGQGDMIVSPLQITMAEAAIANGGSLQTPLIVKNEPVSRRRSVPVDQKNLQIVREGMRQTVVNGTTSPAMFKKVPVPVAAKSGTAETNSPGGRPPHSWYVAFAPYEKPEILATVLVEEGKEGVSFSAPAIAEFMEYYFTR